MYPNESIKINFENIMKNVLQFYFYSAKHVLHVYHGPYMCITNSNDTEENLRHK